MRISNLSVEFSFNDKTILIVEDQKPFQVMLKGMLKNMGAGTVVVSTTGENAVSRCADQPFDIIFIDYNLGTGRNGRQLFEELKERSLIPTHNVSIMVTGESQSTVVVGAIEVNPDDYLVKPFSQNLLKQRVLRAWAKKQLLLPMLIALEKGDLHQALAEVDILLANNPRLKAIAQRYKAEILLKLKSFKQLDAFIDSILTEKKLGWALVYKSKVLQHRGKYDLAIKCAKEAVSLSKFTIEAYDVITDCYLLNNEIRPAYDWIRSGIEKSPFSVPRQYKLSAVAKLNKDFEASIKACSQVVDLTSKSFKKDYHHLLNHIRNIIDICDLEEDVNRKRKFNQEAIFALQKSKVEASSFKGVKPEDFEQICMARLDSANGMNYKAKRAFFNLTEKYGDNDYRFPSELLADSISLMLRIGEYEKAMDYSTQIKRARTGLDDFTKAMVDDAQKQAENKIEKVKMLNKLGIEEYKDGNYDKAQELFEEALEVAPMNTGSALNQIQVLIALIEADPDNRWKYIDKCKHVNRIIEGMPLPEGHRKRADDLQAKFKELQQPDKKTR